MYLNPVLLPQFSNREDLFITVAIYDDDTGQPVNLAHITLAMANPNGFTGSNWTVTDGLIVTSSSTTLTIPGFPIGSQLASVSLTVGVGLGVLAGDPVTIADVTGLNTMTGYVLSYSAITGVLVVQVSFTFQFEIRRQRPRDTGSGYAVFWDIGVQNDFGPLLTASLGNGIMITDVGFLQILIPEAQFRQLNAPLTFAAALTMTDSVNTRQLFIAQLPVLPGGVTN